MVSKRQITPPLRLGGEAFPAHQLKRSSQYAFRGALAVAFITPIVISVFRLNDNSSVSARPGFILLYTALLVWTVAWLASLLKYRELVRATYSKTSLAPGSTRRSDRASRAGRILAWLSAISWAVMLLTARIVPAHSNTLILSPWPGCAFILTGIAALVLTGLSGERATGIVSSEAFHLEEARGLQNQIQMHDAGLRGKTDSMIDSLGERISKRIVDLERLSEEFGNAQRTQELIQAAVDAEMLALSREVYGRSARRERQRQWGFQLLSFVLGFVVNGLTPSVLDLFRGIRL
jgi:hypothetical protein